MALKSFRLSVISFCIVAGFHPVLAAEPVHEAEAELTRACLKNYKAINFEAGCGCWLYDKAQHCGENVPLLRIESASHAWLNLQGTDVKFSRNDAKDTFSMADGTRTEIYSSSEYRLRLDFLQAFSDCPKEKIEKDDGCEYENVTAKGVVTDKKGHSLKLALTGSCGC